MHFSEGNNLSKPLFNQIKRKRFCFCFLDVLIAFARMALTSLLYRICCSSLCCNAAVQLHHCRDRQNKATNYLDTITERQQKQIKQLTTETQSMIETGKCRTSILHNAYCILQVTCGAGVCLARNK